MKVSEVKRLKLPEEEKACLKKLHSGVIPDKKALQVAMGRKF